MPRVESLIESQATVLTLSRSEAEALRSAGHRLASNKLWWGGGEPDPNRTLIVCAQIDGNRWSVTVRDAIGVIVVGSTLQVHVAPKIGPEHFTYLAQIAGTVPRVEESRGIGRAAPAFWELVIQWFILASERLLRRDLARDYELVEDELAAQRGTLRVRQTIAAFYAGRPVLTCEFDEFSVDTALNRLVRAAARTISSHPAVAADLRQRARRIVLRMEDVGDLRPGDIHVACDRRTAYYADALALARQVLTNSGRSLDSGQDAVWTFLFRSPPIIERGIRNLLQLACGPERVQRRGLTLLGSTMTLNPDITFLDGDRAVATADVKYKLATGEWKRADLYQAVTFATGFRVQSAAIFEFRPPTTPRLPPVSIGDIRITHIAWPADSTLPPAESAEAFVLECVTWLASVATDGPASG